MQTTMQLLVLCLASVAMAEPLGCISDSRLHAVKKVSKTTTKVPELKKIFYINLPKSIFRQAQVTNFLKTTSSIPFERFEAIGKDAAKKLDINEFTSHGIAEYMKTAYNADNMYSTVGVYLSHAKLLKKIMAENPNSDDMFLILEDDVAPVQGWQSTLIEKIMPQVPSDWDVVRIGYGNDNHLRCEDKINNAVYENREPARTADNAHAFYAGTQGYLVRPKSIPKILAQFATMPLLDVDNALMSREGSLRVYGVADPLVWHATFGMSNRFNKFALPQTGESPQTDEPLQLKPTGLQMELHRGVATKE